MKYKSLTVNEHTIVLLFILAVALIAIPASVIPQSAESQSVGPKLCNSSGYSTQVGSITVNFDSSTNYGCGFKLLIPTVSTAGGGTATWSYGSNYMLAISYGFNIPLSATIVGIVLTAYPYAQLECISGSSATCNLGDFTLTSYARDNSIKLATNGFASGTEHAKSGYWGGIAGGDQSYPAYNGGGDYRSGCTNLAVNPSDVSVCTYGSSSDTWGLGLTPADVNSPSFGVAISIGMYLHIVQNSGGPDTWSTYFNIKFIQLTVYYTMPTISQTTTATQTSTSTSLSTITSGSSTTTTASTTTISSTISTPTPASSQFSIQGGRSAGVIQGSSGTVNLQPYPVIGTQIPVTLYCGTPLPIGISCAFNPVTGTPPYASTLTVSATPNSFIGSTTLTVVGYSTAYTTSVVINLEVTAPINTNTITYANINNVYGWSVNLTTATFNGVNTPRTNMYVGATSGTYKGVLPALTANSTSTKCANSCYIAIVNEMTVTVLGANYILAAGLNGTLNPDSSYSWSWFKHIIGPSGYTFSNSGAIANADYGVAIGVHIVSSTHVELNVTSHLLNLPTNVDLGNVPTITGYFWGMQSTPLHPIANFGSVDIKTLAGAGTAHPTLNSTSDFLVSRPYPVSLSSPANCQNFHYVNFYYNINYPVSAGHTESIFTVKFQTSDEPCNIAGNILVNFAGYTTTIPQPNTLGVINVISSNAPVAVEVAIFVNDPSWLAGQEIGDITLTSVNGVLNSQVTFPPQKPTTSYHVVVKDLSGVVLTATDLNGIQAYMTNITPVNFQNLCCDGLTGYKNYVSTPYAWNPSTTGFRVRLPNVPTTSTIRQAVMRWYTASYTFSAAYGGPSLYDTFPLTFTVDGINSTGDNSNIYFTFNQAQLRGYNPLYDSNGWVTKAYINLWPIEQTNAASAMNFASYEFGHAVGIGDLWYGPGSVIYQPDIMNDCCSSGHTITTLDIYSTQYRQVQIKTANTIPFGVLTLPSSIPYINIEDPWVGDIRVLTSADVGAVAGTNILRAVRFPTTVSMVSGQLYVYFTNVDSGHNSYCTGSVYTDFTNYPFQKLAESLPVNVQTVGWTIFNVPYVGLVWPNHYWLVTNCYVQTSGYAKLMFYSPLITGTLTASGSYGGSSPSSPAFFPGSATGSSNDASIYANGLSYGYASGEVSPFMGPNSPDGPWVTSMSATITIAQQPTLVGNQIFRVRVLGAYAYKDLSPLQCTVKLYGCLAPSVFGVLQWTRQTGWVMYGEAIDNDGNVYTSPMSAVSVGDTVRSEAHTFSCDGFGNCQWQVTTTDITTGFSTAISIGVQIKPLSAVGVDFDYYGISNINDLPVGDTIIHIEYVNYNNLNQYYNQIITSNIFIVTGQLLVITGNGSIVHTYFTHAIGNSAIIHFFWYTNTPYSGAI